MIVLFDTNVWTANLYFRSPAGSALRYFLKTTQAKVALPEVVKLEVERRFREDASGYMARAKDAHERLLAMFGELKELVLPTPKDVDRGVAGLFENLGVPVQEVAFNLEAARESFLRTIDKRPPSRTTQQFKDGVIWWACRALLETDDVILVSSDSDFYEGGKVEAGLATSLREECRETTHTLTVFAKLDGLLTKVQSDAGPSEKDVWDAGWNHILNLSHEWPDIGAHGFDTIGGGSVMRKQAFATEDPSRLYVQFAVNFEVSGRPKGVAGVLTIEGDGMFSPETKHWELVRNLGHTLRYVGENGAQIEIAGTVIHMDLIEFGHRTIKHKVRYPLDANALTG